MASEVVVIICKKVHSRNTACYLSQSDILLYHTKGNMVHKMIKTIYLIAALSTVILNCSFASDCNLPTSPVIQRSLILDDQRDHMDIVIHDPLSTVLNLSSIPGRFFLKPRDLIKTILDLPLLEILYFSEYQPDLSREIEEAFAAHRTLRKVVRKGKYGYQVIWERKQPKTITARDIWTETSEEYPVVYRNICNRVIEKIQNSIRRISDKDPEKINLEAELATLLSPSSKKKIDAVVQLAPKVWLHEKLSISIDEALKQYPVGTNHDRIIDELWVSIKEVRQQQSVPLHKQIDCMQFVAGMLQYLVLYKDEEGL